MEDITVLLCAGVGLGTIVLPALDAAFGPLGVIVGLVGFCAVIVLRSRR